MSEMRYVPRARGEGEEEADIQFRIERANNERLKAEERQTKLDKMHGGLIERAACLRQASYVMTSIRQRLMLVPTLAARRFKGIDKHQAKAIIGEEIRAALEELSHFPEKVTDAHRWERMRK